MRILTTGLVGAAAAGLIAVAGVSGAGAAGSAQTASGGAADARAAAGPEASAAKRRCHPNYRGRCLKPNASDYDCAGGSGNGPYYVSGPFRVVGSDPYRLDADHDGIACES